MKVIRELDREGSRLAARGSAARPFLQMNNDEEKMQGCLLAERDWKELSIFEIYRNYSIWSLTEPTLQDKDDVRDSWTCEADPPVGVNDTPF